MAVAMKETKSRSITKAVLYRFIGVLGTAVIVFLFTRKIEMSAGIAVADFICGVIFYYVFERIWNIIPWGKK
jgi:uncharacterized membrane protein